jgi:putative adenylate-forming enzyme
MVSAIRLVLQGLQQKRVLGRTLEQIKQLQQKRLHQLVQHAKSHSPFYAERFRDIDPDHFELEQLPVTTKAEMMGNFDRFLTVRDLHLAELEEFMSDPTRLGQWYRGQYALSHTSGSSGMQAVIVQDRAMLELLFSLQMLRGNPFALSFKSIVPRLFTRTRLAVVTIGQGFFPSASALAYAPRAAHRFINRLWVTKIEPVDEMVGQLNRFQPEIILAYANVFEILAREALAGRLALGKERKLQQIINMSEPLSQGARRLIEEAFGIRVTDNYAMGECMALSTGCLQGKGMHLQADWAMLEVVDRNNRPVPDGEPGEKVLVTNLYNTIQPFIRYEIHDVVTFSKEPCPCGSPLPLILSVEGRTDEVVWIQENGKYRPIHPYVFVDMLDEYPAVGWYQVTQTERNRFRLRAAPAPNRSFEVEDLRKVIDSGLLRFGLKDLIQVDINKDEHIAPDQHTGKLKRITSEIGEPKT